MQFWKVKTSHARSSISSECALVDTRQLAGQMLCITRIRPQRMHKSHDWGYNQIFYPDRTAINPVQWRFCSLVSLRYQKRSFSKFVRPHIAASKWVTLSCPDNFYRRFILSMLLWSASLVCDWSSVQNGPCHYSVWKNTDNNWLR